MPTFDEILEQSRQQVTGQPPVTVATPQEEEDKNTVGEAFQYALDQPLENIGVTLETLGAKDVGKWLREITEEPENYESSTAKFINAQSDEFLDFKFDNFGLALVEQAGQLVGSIASRIGGAAVGASVAGAPGAVAGAIAGPALFEGVQQLGPIVQERLRRDGREGQEPTWEDWTAAAAGAGLSGLLNAIGIKNVGSLNRELAKATIKAGGREMGTEATQEVIQEIASGVRTQEGVGKPKDVAKQAFGAGLLGGTTAAGVQATTSAIAKTVQDKEPRVSAVDDFDEKVETETERRVEQINPANLDLQEIPETIKELGFEATVLPGESRESLEKKLKGFVKEQVQREFIREETDKDLLAPLREPSIRAQEQKRFDAMSTEELLDYVEKNIGTNNYEAWANSQGYTPSGTADYSIDKQAFAEAETRARMSELGLPYKFSKNEYNDYVNALTDKYTVEDLRDLAIGYFDVPARQARASTAKELAQKMADRGLTFRLQQQKTANSFTEKSEYINIPEGMEDLDKYRREIEPGGNAITAVVELTDADGKTFGVNFERLEAINPLMETADPLKTASGALFLSPNQPNPKAKEYVDSLGNIQEETLDFFLARRPGQLRSLELPESTLPQFSEGLVDRTQGFLSRIFRPYGETGFEVGRRSRENISRQRALNENAKDISREYEEAVLAAYKNGELDTQPETFSEKAQARLGIMPKPIRQEVDRLAMAFLRNTGARVKLDPNQRAEYQKEIGLLREEFNAEPTEEGRTSIQEDIDAYETALSEVQKTAVAAEQLPESIRKPMIRIRESIDSLSKRILDLPNITDEERQTIQENINRYITRSFAIFEPGLGYNPKFSKDWLKSKKAQDLYDRAVASVLYVNRNKPNYTQAKAKKIIDSILKLEQMESSRDFARLPSIFTSTENRVNLDAPSRLVESRGVIPYPIRKLMGEIEDPALVAATSLQRLSRLVEQAEFYNDIMEINQRPGEMLFSPEPIGQYNVPIAENDFNPLSGMFTTNQIADALGTEINEQNDARALAFSIYDAAFLLPKALTQMGIIVLSPATQSRNFIGGAIMFVANGFAGKNGIDAAIQNVKHNLFGNMSYENGRLTVEGREAQRNFKRMQELGIVNTSVRLNDAADLFARISNRSYSTVGRMSHAVQTLKQTPPGQVVDRTLGKLFRGAQATYSAADDFWKMAAFGADRMRMKEMLDSIEGTNVTDDVKLKILQAYAETLTTKLGGEYKSNLARTLRSTTDLNDYIDEVAAYHVRMGMPNYDYVGKFAQVIRQFPFGNFIAFPTEIMRTAVGNLPQIAYKQSTFKIPDEITAEGGILPARPLLKQEDGSEVLGPPTGIKPFISGGLKRTLLGGSAVYGLGATLQALGQYIFDVDDEDLEAVTTLGPEYAENSRLMPISEIKDGKGEFVNLDYILPYEGLASVMQSIYRVVHEGEFKGKEVPPSIFQGIAEWVIDYTSAYTDASISSRVQAELLLNLDFDTNKPIYNPEDNWGDITKDMFDHAVDNAAPGAVPQLTDLYKAFEEGDDRYDKYGRDKDWLNATAKIVGLATTEMDADVSYPFKINGYKRTIDKGVESNLQPLAYSQEKITEEMVLAQWRDAQEIWFRVQQQMYFDLQAFKKVGISNKVVREQLKRIKDLPGVDSQFIFKLQKGIFTPYKPPNYIRKGFNETKKELQDKEREAGRDPKNITRTWPTIKLRNDYFELRNKEYKLTEYSSLPLEDLED